MKKILLFLMLPVLLAGCREQPVMETVNDVPVQPVAAPMHQVLVELPKDAATPTVETDAGKLYICDNFTVSQQTLTGGDLAKTVKSVSGFDRDALKIMQTNWENAKRYDFVWTAAGEAEAQVCRACILDDGNYHYVLTATADASNGGQLQNVWREMFDSFRLVSAEMPLDTGS